MKKLFLFLFLSLGLTSISYGGYLDDWTNDQLCGWMDNTSPPAHIVAEVKKRELSCESGVAVKTKTTSKVSSPAKAIVKTNEQMELIDELINSNKVTILVASDVSQASINITKKGLDLAESTWFNKGSNAWNYFHPILLIIVGNDMDAAIELENRLCLEIKENFPDSYQHSRCNPRNKDSNCKYGVCYITEYASNGGAGIASSRMNEGFHLMIMSAKRPSPDEEDYKPVTLHESFHIYQLSHVTTKDRDLFEQKTGRRSGDHNRDVPWWSEGTAEYMAQLLYSKQPGVRSNYLRDKMGWKLEYSGSGVAPRIDEYFNSGIKLYNFDYGKNRMMAYDIGAWFAAYLINDVGEERVYEFYENLNELGFENSFLRYFGRPYREYIDNFDVFFKQPINEILKILP